MLAVAALSRSDSGTGTGPQSDETPPSVLATDPAAGASGAARTGPIQASFSEPIAAATVNAATFTVTGGGAGVAGTVSASGSVARWTPDAPLVSGTQYTATLTTGITDVAGNPLAQTTFELGVLMREIGRFDEADVLLQRTLGVRTRLLDAGHPHIALTLREIGVLLMETGRYAEAEARLGENDPDTRSIDQEIRRLAVRR